MSPYRTAGRREPPPQRRSTSVAAVLMLTFIAVLFSIAQWNMARRMSLLGPADSDVPLGE